MDRSIVVGINGSKEATDAARVAASLARDLDRQLVLAHVVADPARFPYGDRDGREARRSQLLDDADALLEAAGDEIGQLAASRKVMLGRVGHGYVEDGLSTLARVEQADLLVVGSRARRPLMRALLGGPAGGSTAFLASMSASPVLVVPRGAGRRFQEHREVGESVICGIDGSPGSELALEVASDLAAGLGLGVLPVSVGNSKHGGGDRIVHVAGGDPAATLAKVASWNQAPLIVVGMRASEARRRSVSRRLAVRAPVPVLIVPPAAGRPRFSTARSAETALAA